MSYGGGLSIMTRWGIGSKALSETEIKMYQELLLKMSIYPPMDSETEDYIAAQTRSKDLLTDQEQMLLDLLEEKILKGAMEVSEKYSLLYQILMSRYQVSEAEARAIMKRLIQNGALMEEISQERMLQLLQDPDHKAICQKDREMLLSHAKQELTQELEMRRQNGDTKIMTRLFSKELPYWPIELMQKADSVKITPLSQPIE